jgi:hypothetical protein
VSSAKPSAIAGTASSDRFARVISLFRDRETQLIVNNRHREARLDALRRGIPEIVDRRHAPPDELAARRAQNPTERKKS